MTDYGAYDAGLPCKNTACKSHGKPHPNCRCYGNLAHGGKVTHYCDEDRAHSRLCEYFKDGGEVQNIGSLSGVPADDAVLGYLSHGGLHHVIKLPSDQSPKAIDRYDSHVKRGHRYVDDHIDHLFDGKTVDIPDVKKRSEYIKNWMDKGGALNELQHAYYGQGSDAQNFAAGGLAKKSKDEPLLKNHAVIQAYPSHGALLEGFKGRAADYLGTLKPNNLVPRKAFDDDPDQSVQKKSYQKAVDIAAHPLDILKKIKKGTLDQESLQHFNALYPELNEHLKKKITERIVVDQLKKKKPNYRTRLALSMFMGAPLVAELDGANLRAAQATFQVQRQAHDQGNMATKSRPNSLQKEAQAFLTPNQAAASRQQKQ